MRYLVGIRSFKEILDEAFVTGCFQPRGHSIPEILLNEARSDDLAKGETCETIVGRALLKLVIKDSIEIVAMMDRSLDEIVLSMAVDSTMQSSIRS
jgi:hypothetical protein